MKLSDYLAAREETANAFARRAGINHQIVYRVVNDPSAGVTMTTAERIRSASRAEPAPCGGTVTFEDLLPVRADDGPEAA